jgi:hypothetical protein
MQTSYLSRDELTTVSEEQLILAISSKEYRNDLMFAEAVRRGLMTAQDAQRIKADQLEIYVDHFSNDFNWRLGKPWSP